jgi:hypothetical protein
MERNQRLVNWYHQSLKMDKIDLENAKNITIKELTGITKQDIFKEPKKLTIWEKFKRILNF